MGRRSDHGVNEAQPTTWPSTAATKTGRVLARWVWLDAKGHDEPRAPLAELAPMSQDQIVVVRDDQRRLLLTYVRVDVPEPTGRLGGLEIAQSLEQLDSYVKSSLRTQIWTRR